VTDARERSPEVLEAARVGRAHGLDGSFYVTGPLTRLLTLGAAVTVEGRRAEVVRRAGTQQRPIVRLDCVGDRAAAEALRGAPLTVARSDAPALGEGEWWAHELEGCTIVDDRGQTLGTVTRLIGLPSCEVLEVAREGAGQPLLVPMVKDAIREIDVAERRIRVDAGFLDIEAEGRGRDGD
jgi:16S rRNA processing protein RimM